MKNESLVMLAGDRESTRIIYNALIEDFNIEKVIIEKPLRKTQLLKGRIRKIGYFEVFGQILFKLMVVPYLRITSRKYIIDLKKSLGLDDNPIDKSKLINVISANSEETISLLKEINPKVVVINGTRIISKKVLNCISGKFINMHTGITPTYRGSYGAYWALIQNDRKSCGVTIHFVDAGIDTGNVISQSVINPTKRDNITTYQLLQNAAGIPLLKEAIKNILEGSIKTESKSEMSSRLWYHPTLWGYIWNRILYGIK